MYFDKGHVFVVLQIKDMFAKARIIKLGLDGHTIPFLNLQAGKTFPIVDLLSYDGTRLNIVYRLSRKDVNLATIYQNEPLPHCTMGQTRLREVLLSSGERYRLLFIPNVTLISELESQMASADSRYARGRIGAEIAYRVARMRLGLNSVILEEPSRGGKDLYTIDRRVMIQARLLRKSIDKNSNPFGLAALEELEKMARKLRQDFRYNKEMEIGYAILSFLQASGIIHTYVLELRRLRA
jgi:hypothetical protein